MPGLCYIPKESNKNLTPLNNNNNNHKAKQIVIIFQNTEEYLL